MKEHYAADLQDRRIRIEGPIKVPVGYKVLIIADDEEVNNCMKIELTIVPREVIIAKLTLAHVGPMLPYGDGGMHADVTTDTFETTDVEVRLSAYVEAVDDTQVRSEEAQ